MPSQSGLSALKILHVEDLPDIQTAIRRLVTRQFGGTDVVKVTSVPSAKECRKLLATDSQFDVILLDWDIEDTTGDQVFNEIRTQYSHLTSSCIFLCSPRQEVQDLCEQHNIQFLPKPCEAGPIKSAIQHVLDFRG